MFDKIIFIKPDAKSVGKLNHVLRRMQANGKHHEFEFFDIQISVVVNMIKLEITTFRYFFYFSNTSPFECHSGGF